MFLDVGAGIFISVFASYTFGVPMSAHLLALGVISALLPDIDMLWFAAKRLMGSHARDHRSFTHYPLLYVPLAATAYFLWGGMAAFVLAAGAFLHLLHDTIWLGWGIAWLAPFSSYKYRLWPLRSPEGRWIRAHYLRPGVVAYAEYGTLALALACLYLYTS